MKIKKSMFVAAALAGLTVVSLPSFAFGNVDGPNAHWGAARQRQAAAHNLAAAQADAKAQYQAGNKVRADAAAKAVAELKAKIAAESLARTQALSMKAPVQTAQAAAATAANKAAAIQRLEESKTPAFIQAQAAYAQAKLK